MRSSSLSAVTVAAQDYIDGCVRRSEYPDRALLSIATGLTGEPLERFVNAQISAFCIRSGGATGSFTSQSRGMSASPYARRKKKTL